ncbi:MAG: hypothetical protein ING41_08995 [Burkholderiales bacterium]|jgi:hypothetical protein|nr:hypothetical protein [Burkholderiales bacterium]
MHEHQDEFERPVGRWWPAVAGLLAAVSMGLAQAQSPDPVSSPLRLSGFATLGLTHHSNETAEPIISFQQESPARKGWSGRLDTVAGLQADLRLLESTSATLQGVVRAGEDFEPRLRMAYLRQQFGADAAVRVGRFRSPFYLDSDVSEIGYAYLMARPPMPIYGFLANLVPHVDGADIQWRRSFGSFGVLVQGYGGRSSSDFYFFNTTPVDKAEFKFSDIYGLALTVGFANVTVRGSHTRGDQFTLRSPLLDQFNGGLSQVAGGLRAVASAPLLPAPVAAGLTAKAAAIDSYRNPYDGQPSYTSLGFDANIDRWRLIGEWVAFDSRSPLVGRSRGGQLTAGYTWGNVTPFVSVARNSRRSGTLDTGALSPTGLDPQLDGAIAQLNAAFVAAALFADRSASSVSVGLRWDVRENAAIKLQFDQVRTPSPMVPGVMAVRRLPIDNRVNLFSASLNVIF